MSRRAPALCQLGRSSLHRRVGQLCNLPQLALHLSLMCLETLPSHLLLVALLPALLLALLLVRQSGTEIAHNGVALAPASGRRGSYHRG